MSGLDEELDLVESKESTNLVEFEPEKKKRKLFHLWEISDKESYKLKLSTKMIETLETKYKTNIMNIVMIDGLPPLSIMLTIIQASLTALEHGFKSDKVAEIYDRYVDNGGNQTDLLANVIIPTLAVSGFFPQEQADKLMEHMDTL